MATDETESGEEGRREIQPTVGMDEFDNMPLDLSREEKRRMAALAMAIKYYVETIVKDGQLYTAMISTGKQLQPATVLGVIKVAHEFESFLIGKSIGQTPAIGNEFEPRPNAGEEPAA